jgi:ATP-dependent DNA helicase DinG
MGLQADVLRVFEERGSLSNSVEQFKPRSGQIKMALEVARTLETGGALVVEAGTGVGKTFAYLVPVLLKGERVLLSTATKALQDQLFSRDIPKLLTVLGLPTRVALLKGRGSYLCKQHMSSARQNPVAQTPTAMRDLAHIESWSLRTRSGDLGELTNVEEDSAVMALVTSTRDNCLGASCPKINDCHINLARREAMAADVVVINHHLFFADLNVRESGVAELLPSVTSVVFDEAHQLNEIGIQFLGRQLSTSELSDFSRDLALHGIQWARGIANWHLLAMDVEQSVNGVRKICSPLERSKRIRWGAHSPQDISFPEWESTMTVLKTSLDAAKMSLQPVAQNAPQLNALLDRADHLLKMIEDFAQPVEQGCVRWLDIGNQITIVDAPLNTAQTMRSRVFGSASELAGRRSWIFTSATLGSDSSMAWFVESCGLDGAAVLQVESPFDYSVQASLYVPPHLPKPNDPSHAAGVAMLVAQGAEILGGRTLVLTTTLRAMRNIGDSLCRYFNQPSDIEVLVQGQFPKRVLLERFSQGNASGRRGCILVASATFWEGVDIPGDALQLLVIDKLPFAPPTDPLVQARVEYLEADGKNAFKHLHLPQAVIALKQGAGRLIRRETDRGILIVCDVRLSQMGYGRKLIAALPPMQAIESEDQFRDALISLTKSSTTEPVFP